MFNKKTSQVTEGVIVGNDIIDVAVLRAEASRAGTRFWVLLVVVSLLSSMVMPYLSMASVVASDSKVFDGEVIPGYSMGGIDIASYGVDINKWGQSDATTSSPKMVQSTYGYWNKKRAADAESNLKASIDKDKKKKEEENAVTPLADYEAKDEIISDENKAKAWIGVTRNDGEGRGLSDFRNNPSGVETNTDRYNYSEAVAPYRTQEDWKFWDSQAVGGQSPTMTTTIYPDFVVFGWDEKNQCARVLTNPDSIQNEASSGASSSAIVAGTPAVPHYVPLSTLFEAFGIADTVMNADPSLGMNDMDTLLDAIDKDAAANNGKSPILNKIVKNEKHDQKNDLLLGTHYENLNQGKQKNGEKRDKETDAWNPYPYSMVFSMDTDGRHVVSSIYNNTEAYVYFSPQAAYNNYLNLRQEYDSLVGAGATQIAEEQPQSAFQLGYYLAGMAILEAYLNEALPQDMTRGYVGPAEGNPRATEDAVLSNEAKLNTRPKTTEKGAPALFPAMLSEIDAVIVNSKEAEKSADNKAKQSSAEQPKESAETGNASQTSQPTGFKAVEGSQLMYDFADAAISSFGMAGTSVKLGATSAIMNSLSTYGYGVNDAGALTNTQKESAGQGPNRGMSRRQTMSRITHFGPYGDSAADMSAAIANDDADPMLHPTVENAANTGFYIAPYYPIQQHEMPITGEMEYRFQILSMIPYQALTYELGVHGFDSAVSLSYESVKLRDLDRTLDYSNKAAALAAQLDDIENSVETLGGYDANQSIVINPQSPDARYETVNERRIKSSENTRSLTSRVDNALMSYDNGQMNADNVHDFVDIARAIRGVKYETFVRYYNPLKSSGGTDDVFLSRVSPADTAYIPSFLFQGYECAGGTTNNQSIQSTAAASYDYFSVPSLASCLAERTASNVYYGSLNRELGVFFSQGFLSSLSVALNTPNLEKYEQEQQLADDSELDPADCVYDLKTKIVEVYVLAKRLAFAEAYSQFISAATYGNDVSISLGSLVRAGMLNNVTAQAGAVEALTPTDSGTPQTPDKYDGTGGATNLRNMNRKLPELKSGDSSARKFQDKELVLDISNHNSDINLQEWKDKHNLWGVIIKCGGAEAGQFQDKLFETHYENAKKAGLHIGAYYFTSGNPDQAKSDATHCLSILEGHDLDLPVYLDVEDYAGGGVYPLSLPAGERSRLMVDFCDTIEKGGRRAGIYGGIQCFDGCMQAVDKYALWAAHWTSEKPGWCKDFGMWQQGSMDFSGDVAFGDAPGHYDLDWCYEDYPSEIKGSKKSSSSKSRSSAYGAAADTVYASENLSKKGYKSEASNWTGVRHASSDGIAMHIPSSFKKTSAKDFDYVMQKSGQKHILGDQLEAQVIWCKDAKGNTFVTTAKVAFAAIYMNMFDRHLSEKAPDSYFWDYPSKIAEIAETATGQHRSGSGGGKSGSKGGNNKVVEAALSQVGVDYVYGTCNPGVSFDCSGLVMYCYQTIGIELPHSSELQSVHCNKPASEAVAGDIVWRSGHVGICIGNGQTVEAFMPGMGVGIGTVSGFVSAGTPAGADLGAATGADEEESTGTAPKIPDVEIRDGETSEYDTVAMDYSKAADVDAARTALADYTIAAFWPVKAVDDRDSETLPKQMQNVLAWADSQSAAESEDNYTRQLREADKTPTKVYEIVPSKKDEEEEEEDSSGSGTGIGTGDPNEGDIKVPSDVTGEGFTWTGYGKDGIWYADGSTKPWASGTDQQAVWDLWVSKGKKYDHGIATIDGLFLVACKPRNGDTGFGAVGDVITFYTADNKALHCLVADSKGGDAANPWGHALGGNINIVEMEVNVDETGGAGSANVWYPELGSGNVRSATNHGRHPNLGGNATIPASSTADENKETKKSTRNEKAQPKRHVFVHSLQDLMDAGYEVVDNDGDWGAAPVYSDSDDLWKLQARMVRGVAGETYLATHQLATYTISAVVARDSKLSTTSSAAGTIPYAGLSTSRLLPGASRYATLEAHTVDTVGITSGLSGDLRSRAIDKTSTEIASSNVDAGTAQQLDRKSQQISELEESIVPGVLSMSMNVVDSLTPSSNAATKPIMDNTNSAKANASSVSLGAIGYALSNNASTFANAASSSFTNIEMNRSGISGITSNITTSDRSSATASAAEAPTISHDATYAKWLIGDVSGAGIDLSAAYALIQSVALLLVLIFLMIIAFQNFVGYASGNEQDYILAQTQFKTVFPRTLIAIAMIGLPPLGGGTGFQGGGFILLQIIHSIMDILFGTFMPEHPMSLIASNVQTLISQVGTKSFGAMFVTLLCSLVILVIGIVILLLSLFLNIILFLFWLLSPIAWALYVWPYGTGTMPKGGNSIIRTVMKQFTQKLKHATFSNNAMGNAASSGFLFGYFNTLILIVKWHLMLVIGSILFRLMIADDFAAEAKSLGFGGSTSTSQAAGVFDSLLPNVVDAEIVAPLKAVAATAMLAFITYAMYLSVQNSLKGRFKKAYGAIGKFISTAARKGTQLATRGAGALADTLGKYDGAAGGRTVASTAKGIGARYVGGIARGMEMLGSYATSDAGRALGRRITHHATNLTADVSKRTSAAPLVTKGADGKLQLDASLLGIGQAASGFVSAEVNAHRDRRDIRNARIVSRENDALLGTTAREHAELTEQAQQFDGQIRTMNRNIDALGEGIDAMGADVEALEGQNDELYEQGSRLMDQQTADDEQLKRQHDTIEDLQDVLPELLDGENEKLDRELDQRQQEIDRQQEVVDRAREKLANSSNKNKKEAQRELDAALGKLDDAQGRFAATEARKEAALKSARIAGYDPETRGIADRLEFSHTDENGKIVRNVTGRGIDASIGVAERNDAAVEATRQTLDGAHVADERARGALTDATRVASGTQAAGSYAGRALQAGVAARGTVADMERQRDASHARRRELQQQLGRKGVSKAQAESYAAHRDAMEQSQQTLRDARDQQIDAQGMAPEAIARGQMQLARNEREIANSEAQISRNSTQQEANQNALSAGSEQVTANSEEIERNQFILDWRERIQEDIDGGVSSFFDGDYGSFAGNYMDAPQRPSLPSGGNPPQAKPQSNRKQRRKARKGKGKK